MVQRNVKKKKHKKIEAEQLRQGWFCPHGVYISYEVYKNADLCENYHPASKSKITCFHAWHYGEHVWCHPFGLCCKYANQKYEKLDMNDERR